MNAVLLFLALAWPRQDVVIPPAGGMVNDFAGVIGAVRVEQIERLLRFVRERSGGEIAVVTMKDIGGRDASEIALRIGREWGVGKDAVVGDRARNAGAVILIVPKETSSDGRGHARIEVGQGAEGFIPDAVAGGIVDEAIPYFERRDYGAAIELIAYRVAQRYASEFSFSLDSAGVAVAPPPAPPRSRDGGGSGAAPMIIFFVLIFIVLPMLSARSRRRGRRSSGLGSALPWIILNEMSHRGRSSRGWGGGWGGGGGGGFGGFGGGGGFSGGGAGRSW